MESFGTVSVVVYLLPLIPYVFLRMISNSSAHKKDWRSRNAGDVSTLPKQGEACQHECMLARVLRERQAKPSSAQIRPKVYRKPIVNMKFIACCVNRL